MQGDQFSEVRWALSKCGTEGLPTHADGGKPGLKQQSADQMQLLRRLGDGSPHSWDGCHQHPSSAPCRGVAKLSHLSVVLSSLHLLPSLLTPPSWAVITPHDASVEIAIGAPSSRHFISIVRKLP